MRDPPSPSQGLLNLLHTKPGPRLLIPRVFLLEESTDKAQDSMNWLGTQVMHVLPVGNNQVFYSKDLNTIHKTWPDKSWEALTYFPPPLGIRGYLALTLVL